MLSHTSWSRYMACPWCVFACESSAWFKSWRYARQEFGHVLDNTTQYFHTRNVCWARHINYSLDFSIICFQTFISNLMSIKCDIFQSNYFLIIIQGDLHLLTSRVQQFQLFSVFMFSLLSKPHPVTIINNCEHTFNVTKCFGKFSLEDFIGDLQSKWEARPSVYRPNGVIIVVNMLNRSFSFTSWCQCASLMSNLLIS